MDFEKILKRETEKNKILLGLNKKKELEIDIEKYPSIIITGETGSGKSILLDQILLELITKYSSFEMGIIPIDTSGVELNYYAESRYTLYNAINDEKKAIVCISRVLKEIDRRKELLFEAKVSTVKEYNTLGKSRLPLLVVAIDDDKFLLRNPDMEKMLSGIISQIYGLGILFVLATSDVHNPFFETDRNIFASLLISFDYTNPIESKKANIKDADKLALGMFIAKYDGIEEEYHNYEFDDAIILDILNSEWKF